MIYCYQLHPLFITLSGVLSGNTCHVSNSTENIHTHTLVHSANTWHHLKYLSTASSKTLVCLGVSPCGINDPRPVPTASFGNLARWSGQDYERQKGHIFPVKYSQAGQQEGHAQGLGVSSQEMGLPHKQGSEVSPDPDGLLGWGNFPVFPRLGPQVLPLQWQS